MPGAALGVSYALRMVADSGIGLDWLRWVSPLGWIEQLQPLTAPRPLVLLPIAGFIASTELVHGCAWRQGATSVEARFPTARGRLLTRGSAPGRRA